VSDACGRLYTKTFQGSSKNGYYSVEGVQFVERTFFYSGSRQWTV